eukprot:TRINITY_DN6432_c0_g1_i3.p2 TRINITY_DN6432_c0_g1~~TRINITY_DN6432_c0_g1_i3.p2  ORF type:complete len:146 (-),score=63.67 TRINITY_DN6432_c0_g1_i3:1548-1985(-)
MSCCKRQRKNTLAQHPNPHTLLSAGALILHLQNKAEEQNTLRKLYDNEVVLRKSQLKTMESLVRLVADAAAPIDEDARDELAAQLAGMYQACALQDGGANLDHIMNPERHARAAGGTANLINNMSNVVRSAIFGKQRWGNVFEQE